MIQTSLGISIGGATFYFSTGGVEVGPEGPHFSIPFFTTALGLVGSTCNLIGIVIYKTHMREWIYRHLLVIGILLISALPLLDIIDYLAREWLRRLLLQNYARRLNVICITLANPIWVCPCSMDFRMQQDLVIGDQAISVA